MTETALWYLTIREAGALLRSGELSPVELTRVFLERIDRLDGRLQAYITVLPEAAMAAARVAEAEMLRGHYKGPLHGIPIALKDLYDTKGIKTTASSRVIAQRVPSADATTTTRLAAAGTILLGKLAMHEFALGGPDPTCGFPLARNPWNLEHIPGGSSSGSGTAVAAGLCMGSLGSCTGGSIRGPAAYCSMVGLKPTYGRVSRYGVVPLSWSLDRCGPMTWTVEDTALMLQAIAGFDPQDPSTSQAPVPDYQAALKADIKGLRIGVIKEAVEADFLQPQVKATVMQAITDLSTLGATIVEVSIPILPSAAAVTRAILAVESATLHHDWIRTRLRDYDHNVQIDFLTGAILPAQLYYKAQQLRELTRQQVFAALQQADVLALPGSSEPAPLLPTRPGIQSKEEARQRMAGRRSFTGVFNLANVPALCVPCGFVGVDGKNLPIGLQLAAKPFADGLLLKVAHAYEQSTTWHTRRPPMA